LVVSLFIFCLAPLSAAGQTEEASEVKVLKIHHMMNTQHYYHISAEKFKELVEKNSGGTLKVEIYPLEQLGTDEEVFGLLQSGDVDMFFGAHAAKIAAYAPEWDAVMLPYLFSDRESIIDWATNSEGIEIMKEKLKRTGFQIYSFTSFSTRIPIANRPLKTLADFKGLKIRVMESPLNIDTYRAIGASPVPLPFGEVYTGMQTGVIDACENGIETLYSQKFHEVGKHITEIPLLTGLTMSLMSIKTWDSLTPAQQKVILDAEPEVLKTTLDAIYRQYDTAVDGLKKAGTQIHKPEDDEGFARALKGIWDKYIPNFEPWVQDIVKDILGDRYNY